MVKDIIVYDFDKTIYAGETGTDFFKFYYKNYKKNAIIFSIKYIKEIILYLFRFINLKTLKEKFFVFLENHPKDEINKMIEQFWIEEEKNNKFFNWVGKELENNKKEVEIVVVTSASPKFLLEKFLLKKGYDVVFGTEFVCDKKICDGKEKFIAKIIGENNKGVEKVNKLNEWANKNKIKYNIIKFYSDSLADKPLYDISEKKYFIKNGEKLEGMPNKKTIIDKVFWK